MAVIRVEKQKNYTVMSNYHLQDGNLSLKAKGLLSMMLSTGPVYRSQRPSRVMPTITTSYCSRSMLFSTEVEDMRDTSCSLLAPPNRMPTVRFSMLITSQFGRGRRHYRQSGPDAGSRHLIIKHIASQSNI